MNEGPWIRSKGQSIVLVVAALVVLVPGVPLTIGMFLVAPSDPTMSRSVVKLVTAFLLALDAAVGWVCFRAARSGCRIEPRGLLIRNPRATTLVPWNQIDRFSLGRAGLWPFVGRAHLVDGSVKAIWGIQAPNIAPDNSRTASLIDGLNEELSRRRGLPPPPEVERS